MKRAARYPHLAVEKDKVTKALGRGMINMGVAEPPSPMGRAVSVILTAGGEATGTWWR